MSFSEKLLRWYEDNRRILPWRGEKDPYRIWISEIILQQTRVKQGWEYYLHFIETFPDILSLAEAPLEKVLKVWQGLGYYSRARNLHATAQIIQQHYQGRFPEQYEEIIRLKGVGEYTAAAIASLAFGSPYPAVDGNVFRVICRYYGIFNDIQLSSTRKEVTQRCQKLIKGVDPGEFNQALMDFGALVCTPGKPSCENCPFNDSCYANRHNITNNLPIKNKKINIRHRYFHYFCFVKNKTIIIKQRKEKDIWQGLFELPLIETKDVARKNDLARYASNSLSIIPYWETKHQLSHQLIHAYFYLIEANELQLKKEDGFIIPLEDIHLYPFSQLIAEFFKKLSSDNLSVEIKPD